MRVVYLGNSPVEIIGTDVVAVPGEPVDVPSKIALGLLEQVEMWQKPKRPKPDDSD